MAHQRVPVFLQFVRHPPGAENGMVAALFGRSGHQMSCWHSSSCTLGQLGRFSGHDPRPQRCADSLARGQISWRHHGKGWQMASDHHPLWRRRNLVGRNGWQRVAGRRLDDKHLDFLRRYVNVNALLRSQTGPLAAEPFVCLPTSRLTRLDAPVFRTLPPSSPLPLTARACRYGLLQDAFGHHRSACAVSGMLRRGFAEESAAAHICREAGARMMVNVFVRDLDLGVVDRLDARGLEEDARLRTIQIRPAGRNRIGRSRTWPKSNRWCLL